MDGEEYHVCKNKSGYQTLAAAALLALPLAFLVVYGNVYMMAVDQEAMRQGRDSLRVMSDRIVNDLTEEGCFDEGNHWSVMIAGRPSSNPTFKKRRPVPFGQQVCTDGLFLAVTGMRKTFLARRV